MLEEFIKSQLPAYILQNDSYKTGGKGFIERYLEIFGEELDEESMPKLDGFMDTLGPYLVPISHLEYLEDFQGDIKDFSVSSEHDRRKFLSYLISIYNIKGTELSIRQILALRGILVVDILVTYIESSKYDTNSLTYDGVPISDYDVTCGKCASIIIVIQTKFPGTFNESEIAILTELVNLVLPIDVELTSIMITPPAAPTLLVVTDITVSGSIPTVILSWTSNSGSTEDGFRVEVNKDNTSFVQAGTTGVNVVTYNHVNP